MFQSCIILVCMRMWGLCIITVCGGRYGLEQWLGTPVLGSGISSAPDPKCNPHQLQNQCRHLLQFISIEKLHECFTDYLPLDLLLQIEVQRESNFFAFFFNLHLHFTPQALCSVRVMIPLFSMMLEAFPSCSCSALSFGPERKMTLYVAG